MIEPTTEIVLRRRHFARIIIRFTIVLCIFVALTPFVFGFLQQVPYNWSNMVRRPIFTFRDELMNAGMWAVVAYTLWWLESRLVRWIVPLGKAECPQCGYSLTKLTTSRCPECGCASPGTSRPACGGEN